MTCLNMSLINSTLLKQICPVHNFRFTIIFSQKFEENIFLSSDSIYIQQLCSQTDWRDFSLANFKIFFISGILWFHYSVSMFRLFFFFVLSSSNSLCFLSSTKTMIMYIRLSNYSSYGSQNLLYFPTSHLTFIPDTFFTFSAFQFTNSLKF